MYIDFHTHAFTDSIAEKAISKLEVIMMESGCKDPKPPVTRGTLHELINEMDRCGVDKAVILPIATKPSQQTVVNNWAADVMSEKIFCFGTVHPEADDALAELERIKQLGLYGVKLHPDQQDFFADEERLFPIYEKCAKLGLPLILHAGYDMSSPDLAHCTPKMGAEIIKKVPDLTLIMAHFGGYGLWDDVEKYLVGKNVFLDTAFSAGQIDASAAKRIIKDHGADKILFASDCPWHSPYDEISFINSLDLSDNEKKLIFYQNAEKLLVVHKCTQNQN